MRFPQRQLIARLNRYLLANNRELVMDTGYCHGLTLLWLFNMNLHQENCLSQLLQDIQQDHFPEPKVEQLISHLQWLQHARRTAPAIHQFDLAQLTEQSAGVCISQLLHHKELKHFIHQMLKRPGGLCLASHTHTIGLFKRDHQIYLFNSSEDVIYPTLIEQDHSLMLTIMQALFQRGYLPDCALPIELIRFTPDCLDDSLSSYALQLISRTTEVNQPGLDGITSLYLACDTSNVTTVEHLLSNHADPNRLCREDWYPLHVAAARGNTPIVNLLLKFGALKHTQNRQGLTPAAIAKHEGHHHLAAILS